MSVTFNKEAIGIALKEEQDGLLQSARKEAASRIGALGWALSEIIYDNNFPVERITRHLPEDLVTASREYAKTAMEERDPEYARASDEEKEDMIELSWPLVIRKAFDNSGVTIDQKNLDQTKPRLSPTPNINDDYLVSLHAICEMMMHPVQEALDADSNNIPEESLINTINTLYMNRGNDETTEKTFFMRFHETLAKTKSSPRPQSNYTEHLVA